jgi:hypothetical protein
MMISRNMVMSPNIPIPPLFAGGGVAGASVVLLFSFDIRKRFFILMD